MDAPSTIPRNPLASVLVDTLRIGRQLQVALQDALQDERAMLLAALDLIAERDREIDRLRRANRELRIEIRAAVTGRTLADERQALEDEVRHSGTSVAA